MVNRHGRWYVAGHDQVRDAVRVFRLSRIEGRVEFSGPRGSVSVPDGSDVRELVAQWDTRARRAAHRRAEDQARDGVRAPPLGHR